LKIHSLGYVSQIKTIDRLNKYILEDYTIIRNYCRLSRSRFYLFFFFFIILFFYNHKYIYATSIMCDRTLFCMFVEKFPIGNNPLMSLIHCTMWSLGQHLLNRRRGFWGRVMELRDWTKGLVWWDREEWNLL
jgi:hypothetical protein